MASNLPPGCNESDIPGNRPEDAAWGNAWDTILSEADFHHMSAADAVLAWRIGVAAWHVIAEQLGQADK